MNSKNIIFLVNVDWFFNSHRRPLQRNLELHFNTSVIAGDSRVELSYKIDRFKQKNRIPTIKGLVDIFRLLKKWSQEDLFIVVSPVMIFIFHFLFFKRVNAIYNFSGLGQLRRLSKGKRDFIFSLFKLVPSKGRRIIIVQNTDDLEYLKKKLTNKDRFRLELIPGSGFSRRLVDKKEENWGHRDGGIVIGYVGRINKDKGVLNLIRAVNELRGKGCNLTKVWVENGRVARFF